MNFKESTQFSPLYDSMWKCRCGKMKKEKMVQYMRSELVLVLPYKVAQIEYYGEYYDGIIIPDVVSGAHPKAAITLRNRYMIDASDMVICFVENQGGAYSAIKYAKEKEKKIINLFDLSI